jgi:hypothetical protein
VLLERTPAWHPWLRYAILFVGLAAATGLALMPAERDYAGVARIAAVLAVAVALAAPAAYAAQTVSTSHSGALPTAGPAAASTQRGPGGGGFPGAGNGGPPAGFARFGGGGGLGGLLDASTPNAALVKLLRQGAGEYTWVAAAVGANSAAGVEIASDEPVMAIGGFNGTDPTPTLAQFEADVAAGKIHYFLASGGGGGFGGGPGTTASASAIASWVESHFASTTVGGVTVYDLTARTAG